MASTPNSACTTRKSISPVIAFAPRSRAAAASHGRLCMTVKSSSSCSSRSLYSRTSPLLLVETGPKSGIISANQTLHRFARQPCILVAVLPISRSAGLRARGLLGGDRLPSWEGCGSSQRNGFQARESSHDRECLQLPCAHLALLGLGRKRGLCHRCLASWRGSWSRMGALPAQTSPLSLPLVLESTFGVLLDLLIAEKLAKKSTANPLICKG